VKGGPRYHVKFRRHREGRTDYRKRLKLLRSNKIRIVVRKSLKHIIVQFVEYNPNGDRILACAISRKLKKYKWKHSLCTIPAAYLTGLLAGKEAKSKGIKEGILDIGRQKPTTGNRLFAALKGVLDAGIQCPHDPNKLPSEERILGKHLNYEVALNELKSQIMGGNSESK
jgi:large subunit ribosomal protein L18